MFKKIIMLFVAAVFFALPASAATYTVQKGDTLWKIAYKNDVTTKTLLTLNPSIKNANTIYVGQKLTTSKQAVAKAATDESIAAEITKLVNKERQQAGLQPLALDHELTNVAQTKSQDMQSKKYFSHTSPTYGSPFDMMKQFGISYKTAGENIAMGQKTAQQVMEDWMNSPGHRANILEGKFTHIGVGYVQKGHYWTQMFIKK